MAIMVPLFALLNGYQWLSMAIMVPLFALLKAHKHHLHSGRDSLYTPHAL